MNKSYLNGPYHEIIRQLHRPMHRAKDMTYKLLQWDHFPSLREGILILRAVIYWAIRYYWSAPDGPVFIVKLWIWFLDIVFERFYSLNQSRICRTLNHSSILSKKQNMG